MLARLAAAVLAAAPAAGVEVVVGLPHRDAARLDALFRRVSDPKSPGYLNYPTLPELAGIVGAADADVARAEAWLVAQGAAAGSVRVSALRDTVTAEFADHGAAPSLRAAEVPFPVDFVIHRAAAAAAGPPAAARASAPRAASVAAEKAAYGIPADLAATNEKTLQLVWGPGTFGYSAAALAAFKASECPKLNMAKVKFDTKNHGKVGDNYMEGNLDTTMISCFGLGASTLVSNTNTSASTEEGSGFGQALLDFSTELASRETLPQVVSMSLGSLSAYSCDLLCDEAVKKGHTMDECTAFMEKQRQVCMFLSQKQVGRINAAFQILGTRGVTLFAASGDGGSHFSFQKFPATSALGRDLNDISCRYQMPIFPSPSPYMTSVGATEWKGGKPDAPVEWPHSGGGFSWQFPRPPHQDKSVAAYLAGAALPPAESFNASGRGYPDLSAVGTQGTSESAPTIAGIFSLITDARLNAGLPPLGFLGPRLWSVMEAHPGEALEDVTSGNTKTTCDNGFPAAAGWDPATGWGRPKWAGLVKYFASDDNL